MQLLKTKTANNNLRDIAVYHKIKTDSLTVSLKILQAINKSINDILLMPEMGTKGRKEDTYELSHPHFPYIIVYTIRKDTIIILAIIHSSRNR